MIGIKPFAAKTLILFVVLLWGVLAIVSLHDQHNKPVAVATAKPLTSAQFQNQVATLTNLMKTKGVNAAFSYTEQQMNTNPSFALDCHPLLHELGHAAYTYYGGYAKAIVYQNELCDSGYTHGVLESYLSSGPDISQALQTACTSTMSVFDQWQCYHGLGHGVMLVSMENVGQSISLCNSLPTPFAQDACINGVFMQHFVVTDHDGSVPKTNPTSLKDCAAQPAIYKPDCYNYAPSAYLTIYNGQYASAFNWCRTAEKAYIPTCIGGVGSQAMKEHSTDAGLVMQICDMAGTTNVGDCIDGAAGMDVYFHGSATAAMALCQNQFKSYQTVCNSSVSLEKSILHL